MKINQLKRPAFVSDELWAMLCDDEFEMSCDDPAEASDAEIEVAVTAQPKSWN